MAVHTKEEIAAEHRRYMQVFLWLGVLTVLEIATTYLPIAKAPIVVLLIGMALTKASMVGLYYMHLALERRTLMYIAVTPLVLCAFLVFMLAPDLTHMTRVRTRIQPPPPSAEHVAHE